LCFRYLFARTQGILADQSKYLLTIRLIRCQATRGFRQKESGGRGELEKGRRGEREKREIPLSFFAFPLFPLPLFPSSPALYESRSVKIFRLYAFRSKTTRPHTISPLIHRVIQVSLSARLLLQPYPC